ncbi:helix-turn-helix domain-containing protein [Nonomuraea sp. NPDC048916]|uniref:winged helix-turn-helix domain-containing protein n=1 Tax=Nonomuraea sp. NPDC048916 TaxID=3154232 RepID=UPI0033CFEF00
MEEAYKISDPRVLKVVAHPLRVRLLGLLRGGGPATASELGRTVGESSGSTSYHLRELAKYGFIEEDPERRDGRERRWRARHRYTSWDNLQMSATPEGLEAVRIMHLRQVEALARAVEEYDEGGWPEDWVEVAGLSDHLVSLPPAGLRELGKRVDDLVRELAERYAGDPGAAQVHLWTGGFPHAARGDLPDTPGGDLPGTPGGDVPGTPGGDLPGMLGGDLPGAPVGDLSGAAEGGSSRTARRGGGGR